MKYSKLIYKLPNDLGFLEFSSEALEHFENNKQRSCFSGHIQSGARSETEGVHRRNKACRCQSHSLSRKG